MYENTVPRLFFIDFPFESAELLLCPITNSHFGFHFEAESIYCLNLGQRPRFDTITKASPEGAY